MHQNLVVSRTLAGKKPRALPGGVSKRARQEYKNWKGGQYQKTISAEKKGILKQVYVWGFAEEITNINNSAEYYLRCSKKNEWKFSQTYLQNQMLNSLRTIETHYANILPLIQKYKRDFDFEPVFSFNKKLPRLRQAVENFLQNPSEATFSAISSVIRELSRGPMRKLERIAKKKYPVAQEIAKAKRRGFNFNL